MSILQFSFILFIGWYFDRLIEILIIIPCFFFFRSKFEKQYHSSTSWKCTKTTIIIFFIVGYISPSKSASILLDVMLSFLITNISFYVRDYLDIKYPKKKKKNENRQIIIDILGKSNLDEESITNYCVAKGEPKLAETIYLFLNNTLEDTADILEVDTSTITRRICKFIKLSRLQK